MGSAGAPSRVEKDSNGDGRIDQIAHLDPAGILLRLEADSDRDGVIDTFQIYEKGEPVSLERDNDNNGRIDLREFLEKGKRVRQEIFDAQGRIQERVRLDGRERPATWERDTNGDGRPDLWYHYAEGRIDRVEEDRNHDGRPDLWEKYDRSGALSVRQEDLDFDGVADIRKEY